MMSLVFFVVVVHFGRRSSLVICREMKIEHYREFLSEYYNGKKKALSAPFSTLVVLSIDFLNKLNCTSIKYHHVYVTLHGII